MFLRNIKVFFENIKVFFAAWECAKTKPTYPIVSRRDRVCLPKTLSKLFSGERTSPLRTKRWRYPRFDTPLILFNYQFNTIISIPAFAPNSN